MMEFNFRQLGGALSNIEEQLGVKTEIIGDELHINLNKWELQDELLTENEVKALKSTKIIDELRKLVDFDFDYTITDFGVQISAI